MFASRGHYVGKPLHIALYISHIDRGNFFDNNSTIPNMIAYLLEKNDYSLREAERCYSIYTVIKAGVKITETSDPSSMLVAFLKIHDQDLLLDIINKKINIETALGRLKYGKNDNIIGMDSIALSLSECFSKQESVKSSMMGIAYKKAEGFDISR